ncbi:FAD-binding oxidoreductase [Anoxybacteroides amylolyticum]|uniref:FAD-binding oxidoreductase n=1 Tax=Anoxybacteroides amylolyticum TaxID=294699 RepID=UPI00082DC2B3
MYTARLVDELNTLFPEIHKEEQGAHPLGNGGDVALFPQTEDEIRKIVNYAREKKKKLAIIGGGTKRGFGGLVERMDLLLSLANYRGIVEHAVADMVITVKAGTKFQELQDYLAEYRQKIALDPFLPQSATIGGVIAANDSGPKRLGYGAARDSVIGLRLIYPDGTVIRTGGKVVKNVAGYDMNKLFIGSMGTLGILSEITLKLRPLPKYESLVLLAFPTGDTDAIRSFAIQLLDAMMEPVCIELLNPSLAERLTGKRAYTLAIGFEDVKSAVHYQEAFVQRTQPPHTTITILPPQEAQKFWQTFYQIMPNGTTLPTNDTIEAAMKIGVINLDVISVLRESELLQALHVDICAHGGVGHGLCRVYLKGAAESVVTAMEKLRTIARRHKGYAIVTHLPLSLRQTIDVWGGKPSYFFLLEGIKTKIDPQRMFNDQRFVGGI